MGKRLDEDQRRELGMILAAFSLLVAAWVCCRHFHLPWWGELLVFLVPYLIAGFEIVKEAVENLFHGELMDEDFLMAVATIGALILGEYAEAVMVLVLFRLGEWFEDFAVSHTRQSVSELMDIRPDYANLERDGQVSQVDPAEVAVGEIIVIRPGEKVPIDGVVEAGTSSLDTAALTGESLPREVEPRDEVVSGGVNLTGVLRVRTTKVFGESTASKILDLVENAAEKKSRSEDFIRRFARVYTPAVCAGALALGLLPPAVRLLLGMEPGWTVWLYRALAFLVTSCPCALVISIPLSFFAGIGGAGRAGILIKGSNYLEALAKTDTVVFDKTGTLTRGVFEVVGVHHSSVSEAALIEYAALAESASSHPISKSLRQAYGKDVDPARVTDIRELSGEGVTAVVDGVAVAAGNDKLMARLGLPCQPCHEVGTVIHMAVDGAYAGHILISDVLKDRAKEALDRLRQVGVDKTVMLTGDNDAVAQAVAREVGVDQVCSQLLPADKVARVEALLDGQRTGKKLAFVGDGVNDAPVLSRSDIGVAMGAMGSDAAIEAADVVLMDDDPVKIAQAVRLSRKCLAIVYQNIVFAIGVKALCLLLVAVGLANMWAAIFADVGVMVLAVLNAMRCLKVPQ